MIGLVVVELSIAAVMLASFLAVYGAGQWRARRRQTNGQAAAGRQLLLMAGVTLAEVLSLIGLATDHRPPLWVYAVVYGAVDVVLARWLLLLWRARRERQGS